VNDDIIVAIATSRQEAAISIIRLSGKGCIEFVSEMFTGNIIHKSSHTITYGYIVDEDKKIDEVLVNIYRAPRTFTAEDMVEINCHGGIYITNRILSLCLKRGARMAEPGEFTKRAFLNGRLDLSQAEAVIDVIRAKTDKTFDVAMNQLEGVFSGTIKEIRKKENLSQQKFAEKYGVTYQAVSKWENGKNIPDITIIKEICKDYNLDLNDFLDTKIKKKFNNKFKYIIIGIIILTIFTLILSFYITQRQSNNNFEFKTLSSNCTDFNLYGSIAYNDSKSSIYISHIIYC